MSQKIGGRGLHKSNHREHMLLSRHPASISVLLAQVIMEQKLVCGSLLIQRDGQLLIRTLHSHASPLQQQ
eukprot:2987818-Amphidinium_carterae.1